MVRHSEIDQMVCETTKRPKPSGLMDLDEDSIYEILSKMSPKDLASVSLTSKRLREMSFDTFRWNHCDTEAIKIFANHHGIRLINNKESHLRNFGKFISNIIICNYSIDMDAVAHFIKSKCSSNLKSIKLQTNISLNSTSLEMITEQLNSIKSLNIAAIGVKSDLFNGLLKHCKNLEHLEIAQIGQYNTDWLHQQYSNLKSVSMHGGHLDNNLDEDIILVERIGEFFRLNSNITDIQCNRWWIARIALQNIKNIERLRIECEDGLESSNILVYFKKYCQHRFINCLEVCWSDILDVDALKELNSINPIHSLDVKLVDDYSMLILVLFSSCTKFSHLKKLKIEGIDRSKDIQQFEDLSENFPNLKQLHFKTRTTLPFNRVVMPFVRYSSNLRKLILGCPLRYEDDYIDSIALSELRIPLKNAQHMTIGIEVADETEPFPRINKTNQTLVTITRCISNQLLLSNQ